jgi:acyl-CoA thioester hydrolase
VTEPFVHPLTVRYAEVDQQGVVFNAHYLTYFDDAMTAFLADRGLSYPALLESGFDVMVVHTEIDWRGGVGWLDEVGVAVSLAAAGRSSFTLDFSVRRSGEAAVEGRTVYVCVGVPDHGACPLPDALRAALGPVAPLRPIG